MNPSPDDSAVDSPGELPPAPRHAGLLLHPTSLPGRFGIGDLGPGAVRALDWMAAAGFTVWQVLPLGPPAFANTPYTSLSSFALNPLLISPEALVEIGLLDGDDLGEAPSALPGRVDFAAIEPWKLALLRRAWEGFRGSAGDSLRADYEAFVAAEGPAWLDDWVLFAAVRAEQGQRSWADWDDPALQHRQAEALAVARDSLADELAYHGFVQFIARRQWSALRDAAKTRGIRLLGDLPIYVAFDSAEVWANPELFDLEEGRPVAVAGVPPDYFSDTGQRWGNPLYRWDRMAEDGYAWWMDRLAANFALVDLLRLDHFRAFADYWRIPAEEETAVRGDWIDGPGLPFFEALQRRFGSLPLVAEDLGDLSPAVHRLRRALGLPGMRVLQFAFDGSQGIHLPHRLEPASVLYTGTHDNDTGLGWYRSLDAETRHRFHRYSGATGEHDAPWALIRLAYTAVSELAVVPFQDVLGLGSEARMNTPGVPEGNWHWRASSDDFDPETAANLRALVEATGRLPDGGGSSAR